MAHDVFVSYSSKDKPAADAVCATLEARGIRCWIAPRDILPGMDWSGAIVDGISNSRLVILVFSSSSNESPQIKRELERAVNKSLPIIPFRIENVPLSKPLEYFISTPHWLDALTPPMEKHLNYLAETVEVLLQRKTIEEMVPPIPTPKPQENRFLLWGAIAFAFVVLGGGAYLLTRILSNPIKRTETKTDLPDSDHSPKDQAVPGKSSSFSTDEENGKPEEAVEDQYVKQQSPSPANKVVDSRLDGTWKSHPDVDGKPWKLKLRIVRNGMFDFTGTTQDSGSYSAQGGRWETRTLKGESDSGTYTLLNQNMVTIAGRLGTGIWTRVRQRSIAPGGRVDPAMVGSWETSAVLEGKKFTFLFDIQSSGTFQITSTTTDKGRFEAKNGTFTQITNNGTVINGTYRIISPNAVTITGPAGTDTWSR